MPPFRFRLQRVLDVRAREEERERLAFAEAAARKERAIRRLEESERAYRESVEADAEKTTFRIDDLLARLAHRERQLRDIVEAEAERAAAEEAWREARARWIEARKKKRVLERLLERRREAWRIEEERAAQNALDEVATSRFLLRRAELARAGDAEGR